MNLLDRIASLERENARLRRKVSVPRWPRWLLFNLPFGVLLVVGATIAAWAAGRALATGLQEAPSVFDGMGGPPEGPRFYGYCDAGAP
jgi:hypothetical protein